MTSWQWPTMMPSQESLPTLLSMRECKTWTRVRSFREISATSDSKALLPITPTLLQDIQREASSRTLIAIRAISGLRLHMTISRSCTREAVLLAMP